MTWLSSALLIRELLTHNSFPGWRQAAEAYRQTGSEAES